MESVSPGWTSETPDMVLLMAVTAHKLDVLGFLHLVLLSKLEEVQLTRGRALHNESPILWECRVLFLFRLDQRFQ